MTTFCKAQALVKLTGTVTLLSLHQYKEYIVLTVESVCFKNLVKIVTLVSLLIQANRNTRKKNQIWLSSILSSKVGRERTVHFPLSVTLYTSNITVESPI